MADESRRLARIFIWKESLPPDNSYVATLLGVANPSAAVAVAAGHVPVHTFSVLGSWPANLWTYVSSELERLAPTGTPVWTDQSRFDLVGWQGQGASDERIFVVSAYARESRSDHPSQFASSPQAAKPDASPALVAEKASPEGLQALKSTSAYIGSGAVSVQSEAHSFPGAFPSSTQPSTSWPLSAQPLGTGRLSLGEQFPNFTNGYIRYYVGFGPRLLSWLIDLGIILLFTIIGVTVTYLMNPRAPLFNSGDLAGYTVLAVTLLLIYVIYHVVQIALWGQTVGKKLLGIMVVSSDGSSPSWGSSLLRVLGFFFSTALLGWGLAMLALDPRRQSLHDKMAETYVIPEGPTGDPPPNLPGYSRIRPTTPAINNTPVNEPVTSDPMPPQPDQFTTGPFVGFEVDSARLRQTDVPNAELARALFKKGLAEMHSNTIPSLRGFRVDNQSARVAATSLHEALEIVPNSVLYRYFYAVALRYAEGFESSLREFRKVLELDPGNYEARQQVNYGPRWHDAYAYPVWPGIPRTEPGDVIPPAISALLPAGSQPVTRLVLLREGANKLAAFVTRVPHDSWPTPPPSHMTGGIHVVLSRTSFGPVLALYVMLADFVHSPYIGETFLNPAEAPQGSEDACQLGQHLFDQLARQDHSYAIFVDEGNRLLLTRRLPFDTNIQVLLARVLYETQSLPKQPLSPDRFRQAAEWHMQNIALQEIADQLRPA